MGGFGITKQLRCSRQVHRRENLGIIITITIRRSRAGRRLWTRTQCRSYSTTLECKRSRSLRGTGCLLTARLDAALAAQAQSRRRTSAYRHIRSFLCLYCMILISTVWCCLVQKPSFCPSWLDTKWMICGCFNSKVMYFYT